MPDLLLTVKLFAPPLRPGLVRRLRLLYKLTLAYSQGCRFTLVSAPAGYGKTTLVRDWLDQLGHPYGWLSLERSENHPVQFLAYLLAALRQVEDSSTAAPPQPDLTISSSVSLEDLEGRLFERINQLALRSQPFLLVLDDYHVISDLSVHALVEFLIAHQPPLLHLVIITRQDPLLPLSNLRARGQLSEVRLSDLRFTDDEAALFLNDTLDLGLQPQQVAVLTRRTEGWIAGLQLAGLSLMEISGGPSSPKGTNGPGANVRADFFEDFAGDNRHIMDYLMDEVLSREPESVQQFLLNTSVLKRMCAPLCDAMMEGNLPEGGSQALLERLEKANLFIIPMDHQRRWYRYHHLFADLLAGRLQTSYPERLSGLHALASQWFEKEGQIPEAVDHALLAEDFDRALRLMERTAHQSIWSTGDLPILLNWSKRLPEDILLTRPRLALYYARALFFQGQVEPAQACLDSAERALQGRSAEDPTTSELWGVLWSNRATIAAMRGEASIALELVTRAEAALGESCNADPSSCARLLHARGVAEQQLGHLSQAAEAFSAALALSRKVANRNLGLDLAGCLAQTYIELGDPDHAVQVCEEALETFPGGRSAPAACAIFLALAQLAYQQNDLSLAASNLDLCLSLCQQAGWSHILWQAWLLLAQLRQASGDYARVEEALRQAERAASSYALPRVFRRIAAARLQWALDQENVQDAQSIGAGLSASQPGETPDIFLLLARARLWLALGRYDEVQAELEEQGRLAEAGERVLDFIEISLLCAQAALATGDSSAASQALLVALDLAAACKYSRPFLNQGSDLAPLLSTLLASGILQGSGEEFARRLLTGLGISLPPVPSPIRQKARPQPLVEPLSERELEVLALIAEGLSNPEIAARLYLSVNTLRAHTTHIYRKLDVHNRIQAVELARSLNLLPPV